ncbi:MAG: M23 family metallopeptidase, partial [Chloroflexota bacterium]
RGTEPEFGGAGDPQTAPELFRRISQRSQFGGRINAFFDHQYPVYPPRVSGWEPISTTTTLLLFDGSLSDDAFSRQDGQGDYYSGHTGIDFAPVDPFNPTTPVLAAAAGRLTVARVDDDGNHWVRLEHDPDGDGRYQYATLYFHLHDDEHFARTLALYEQAASEGAAATGAWPEIQAGERIGTMGTTGRSSGIHLHFEVRYDANKDRFFSRLETVDPYGFFPGPDADPWNAEVDLEDNNGEVQRHRAIASEYLWRHPFIQVEDEMAGDCVETVNVQAQVDLYPVLGWAVIDPGFTFIARNAQGQAVTAADSPRVRRLTVSGESLQGVDRDSIVLVFFDPVLQNWPVVATPAATPQPNGNYTFQVEVIRSAHYVLVGRETSDREPPITTILFSAPLRDGDAFTFEEPVTITLVAEDQSPPGVLAAGVARIQYSPDCGRTWLDYTRPITVTLADRDEYRCGDSGSGEQGIELGANDFIILAIAEDSLHNIQQPASQARFTVIGD